MADPLSVAASIIAVIQLADRICGVCRSYINAVQEYPKDLRLILVETASLKVAFDNLKLLRDGDPEDSDALQLLCSPDGPVEGCRKLMEELGNLLLPPTRHNKSKTGRVQALSKNLAWSLKSERARKLLDSMMQHKSTINLALSGEMLRDVHTIKLKLDKACQTLSDIERREVCNWFQHTDPSPLHNVARRLYEEGTGSWIFRSAQWDDWINSRCRGLWMHGIPGAGKTVLVSRVAEEITRLCNINPEANTMCVYYYCYHGHNQDEAAPFVRWLVVQLCRVSDKIPALAYTVFKNGREPGLDELMDILLEALSFCGTVYVAIDALDESKDRENLLKVIRNIIMDPRFSSIQLFATSREYFDVEQVMSPIARELPMSNALVEADIKLYVASTMASNSRFRSWPSNLRCEVEEILSKGARGMFRWAVCQIDILRRLKSQRRIQEALKDLPDTLDETYERIFAAIDERDRTLLRHVLHWICFHDYLYRHGFGLPVLVIAQSYQHIHEASEETDFGDAAFAMNTLKDSCGCLVTFQFEDEIGDDVAMLAHYTVREFLESNRACTTHSSFFRVHLNQSYWEISSFILNHCMSSVQDKSSRLWMWRERGSTALPLGDYCVASSAECIGKADSIRDPDLAFRLFDPCRPHFAALCDDLAYQFYSEPPTPRPWNIEWDTLPEEPGLVILINLALMGAFDLAKIWLHNFDADHMMRANFSVRIWNNDSNDTTYFRGTLPEFMSIFGRFDEEFLRFVVEVSHILAWVKSILPVFMLHFSNSFYRGNNDCVITKLLGLGADINGGDSSITPLQVATATRNLYGVQTLLEAGADPNHIGNENGGCDSLIISALNDKHQLSGQSPLHICRSPVREDLVSDLGYDFAYRQDIEELLLFYGAEEISHVVSTLN